MFVFINKLKPAACDTYDPAWCGDEVARECAGAYHRVRDCLDKFVVVVVALLARRYTNRSARENAKRALKLYEQLPG